ncbi:MAG: twin-arginine translocation signal domain-containing protein, partial [Actinomycetota bacterium]|nr:twin-arginine translocation signal domain-containing protein [Actinomycetota bacterium]
MGSKFTRRWFLKAAGAGAAYLALAGTVGSEPVESYPKVRSVRTPRVKPLLGVPFPPQDGNWAFRSRPDLNPPAVEVSTQAHEDTAPGYIFLAPEKGG